MNDPTDAKYITDVPDGFTGWVGNNAEKLQNWKTQPFFVRDNFVGGRIENGLKANITGSVAGATGAARNTVTGFVPAKSIEEAKLFAKNNLGIIKDERKLNLEAINQTNKWIYELNSDFNTKEYLTELYTDTKGQWGLATRGRIRISPKHFNNKDSAAADYRTQVKTKFHPRIDSNIDARKITLDHEFGHCLTMDGYWNTGKINLTANYEIEQVKRRYYSALSDLAESGKNYKDSDIFVSDYCKTNTAEFVAECFTHARNCTNASPYAKEVYDIIKKYYGRK
jgi:hypothetical protein